MKHVFKGLRTILCHDTMNHLSHEIFMQFGLHLRNIDEYEHTCCLVIYGPLQKLYAATMSDVC